MQSRVSERFSVLKAAFFDIDGTLLSFKTHAMPASTVRALDALRANGIKTVISTGRSPLELPAELQSGFDAHITINGQLCYDDAGAFRDSPFVGEDVRVIVDKARAGEFDILVSQLGGVFVSNLSPRVRAVGKQVGLTYVEGDLDRALAAPVYQLCAFVEPGEEQRVLEGTHSLRTTRWTELFCDVVPKEGGKDVGVHACCERFGITPDECIAFGDGENDLTMFSAVGTAVAMGNAWDQVKAAADYVTDDVDADGIWNACRHFGLV